MLHYRLHRDPKSSHQQISTLVQRLGRSPVLDVGAAQGFLGQLLHATSLTIDAVEPNPYWAERAQPFYRQVFASSIEEANLPADTYRVIVCADVLEHTVDPRSVIQQLCRVATDDAWFIISLPNVAHLAVRLLLLMGRFPQMERGILDRTHLHFYTLDTATDLLRSAGLEVVRARPTGVPLDELWPSGEDHPIFTALMRLQHLALLLAPRLFGFQWVMVARKEQRHPEGTRNQEQRHSEGTGDPRVGARALRAAPHHAPSHPEGTRSPRAGDKGAACCAPQQRALLAASHSKGRCVLRPTERALLAAPHKEPWEPEP